MEQIMSEQPRDIWSEWLLNRRFGGNAEQMKLAVDFLYPVRDKVLQHANLGENETLLDVGCGDGLIAFGALGKFDTVKVILSDISQGLLDHAHGIAQSMGSIARCQFVRAQAEDLAAIENESVHAVTTRSVLIYVAAKSRAFDEFYRVLKPHGRLSIFEPINSFRFPDPEAVFAGYDVTPVVGIAKKVKAVYHRLQPPESDPMLDFDERDLVMFAEQAGFQEIHLELQIEIKPKDDHASWERMLRIAGNPKIPNLEEAMQEALTPTEQESFIAHLRPLVEAKQGVSRSALAYLWAIK
jgi:arsenite methyltransferase